MLIFQDEGHLLYTDCLLYILTLYSKCLLFQFSIHGIHMHILILRGVQNGRISRRENSLILLQNVVFEAYFPRWRPLVFQILVYILTIYCTVHVSVFKSWHTNPYFHRNRGSKWTNNLVEKWSPFDKWMKLEFQDESYLSANCLIYIFFLYLKCLRF